MAGKIDVLNSGKGHLEIVVPENAGPADKVNYERIINDMLSRGYLLFIEHKGQQIKIDRYDAKAGKYILAAYPEAQKVARQLDPEANPEPVEVEKPKRGRPPRVGPEKANVTAIPRSAGG